MKNIELVNPVQLATNKKDKFDLCGRVAVTFNTVFAEKNMEEAQSYFRNHSTEILPGTILLITKIVYPRNHNLNRGTIFAGVLWNEQTYYVPLSELRLVEVNDSLKDKNIVVTGELSLSREFIKSIILLKGGTFKKSVSRKCDYLILGNRFAAKPTTKLRKARNLGIKILNEQQFFDLCQKKENNGETKGT